MRKIVAFLGTEGSGKTYNSNKLVQENNFLKVSFADALREIAFKVIGMDYEEGMKNYAELKKTKIVNGQNFRNILENLGSAVREQYVDFWVDTVIHKIDSLTEDICIDDMRYVNEFTKVNNYCKEKGIDFKAYFCNYQSKDCRTDNPHESAKLANYLYTLNYKDLQEIDMDDIIIYQEQNRMKTFKKDLAKMMDELKSHVKNR